jgi:hypothetical protein
MSKLFVTFSELIDESERLELAECVAGLFRQGLLKSPAIGVKGHTGRLREPRFSKPEIARLTERVMRMMGVEAMPVDPALGHLITYVEAGGYIASHTDEVDYANTDRKQLRCNVVISKPLQGGFAVIGDQKVDCAERGGWAFFASETLHSAFPISGAKPRIIFSFGFSVPRDWPLPEPSVSRGRSAPAAPGEAKGGLDPASEARPVHQG